MILIKRQLLMIFAIELHKEKIKQLVLIVGLFYYQDNPIKLNKLKLTYILQKLMMILLTHLQRKLLVKLFHKEKVH